MDENKTPSPTPEAQSPQVTEAPKLPDAGVADQENNSTGPKGIAWDQVLQDYLTADENGRYPSLQDLALKYTVAMSTIAERSSRENWVAKRNATVTKAEELAAQKKADDITDANNRHLSKWRRIQNIAGRLLNNFENKLNKYDEAQKNLENESDPVKIKELKEIRQPSIGQLNAITGTLRSAIEGERIVLGLPIVVSKSEVNNPGAVQLPPEMVKEIDRLFEINKNDKPADTVNNS